MKSIPGELWPTNVPSVIDGLKNTIVLTDLHIFFQWDVLSLTDISRSFIYSENVDWKYHKCDPANCHEQYADKSDDADLQESHNVA